MSLPQGKREFIRKLVAGLDNLMEITQIANQIGISPRNEIEEFIKKLMPYFLFSILFVITNYLCFRFIFIDFSLIYSIFIKVLIGSLVYIISICFYRANLINEVRMIITNKD